MNKILPKPFPDIKISDDVNPAIRLFGQRFHIGQSDLELLIEFLAVLSSEKTIGNDVFDAPLPPYNTINAWPSNKRLEYKLPVKLTLKLFSFFSSAPVIKKHKVHGDQYKRVVALLKERIECHSQDQDQIVEWLEYFFQGFFGIGDGRCWSAQVFYPLQKSFLTRETVWKDTKAKNLKNWEETVEKFTTYYATSGRNFLARGGEVLYLQLCNVFSQDEDKINEFASEVGIVGEEANLKKLYESLNAGLSKLVQFEIKALSRLIDYIDSIEPLTEEKVSKKYEDDVLKCMWCPVNSWKEGYLFAIELNRILKASLDPVERLELLMTGCVLQIMRSLSSQSSRYLQTNVEKNNPLGYSWIFSDLKKSSEQHKMHAQCNYQKNIVRIENVLNIPLLKESVKYAGKKVLNEKELKDEYKAANDKYGHKLFTKLGKRKGIICPYTGPGTRFVMTDKLLRYLIATMISPGKRCTDTEFYDKIFNHFGIAILGEQLNKALEWTDLPPTDFRSKHDDIWFIDLLKAGGFLTVLSDSCSIVRNTLVEEEQTV